jgi:hypothetical protein
MTPITFGLCCRYGCDILAGLEQLHSLGIVIQGRSNGLTLANVLVTDDDRAVVADTSIQDRHWRCGPDSFSLVSMSS